MHASYFALSPRAYRETYRFGRMDLETLLTKTTERAANPKYIEANNYYSQLMIGYLLEASVIAKPDRNDSALSFLDLCYKHYLKACYTMDLDEEEFRQELKEWCVENPELAEEAALRNIYGYAAKQIMSDDDYPF